MDNIKSGSFISQLRKEKGLTQKELAEKLSVTDKAVSKWETGRGFPDVSILPALSEILGVSVTEIISGERIEQNDFKTTDKAIIEAYSQRKIVLQIISVIFMIIGVYLSVILSLTLTGAGIFILIAPILGIIFIAAAFFIRTKSFGEKIGRLKFKYIYAPLALVSLIAAIMLEAMPNSFTMRFAVPPDEEVEAFFSYCSHFDMLPVGYGNHFPFLTAVMSCVSALLTAIVLIMRFFKKKPQKLKNSAFICTAVAVFFSLIADFIFTTPNAFGFGIILLLILSLIFLGFERKNTK